VNTAQQPPKTAHGPREHRRLTAQGRTDGIRRTLSVTHEAGGSWAGTIALAEKTLAGDR
jgi:hypothetical protein